jgi:hypothetical protein
MGGAGSGSFPKKDKGLIKTYFIGYNIAASLFFQPIGDSAPGNHSPSLGKSPISFPKIELEANWNTNAKMRKEMTNLFFEIFIILNFEKHFEIQSKTNYFVF